MPLTDRQIRETFKIESDGNGFLIVTFLPPAYTESADIDRRAELIRSDVYKFIAERPNKIWPGIIDLSPLQGKGRVSHGARKIYAELLSGDVFGNVVFVGGNVFLKVMVDFIVKAAGIQNKVKWCLQKEEAIKWLKSKS
jgi:hypothetical protein